MLNQTSPKDSFSDMQIFSLQNVDMSFGSVRALNEIGLSVNAGECIGLVGHNGAGKSTLVNVINGRLTPTSGEVTYHYSKENKKVDNALTARLCGVRCVFQELSLCANLTVLENLRIPFRSMPKRHWRKKAAIHIQLALDTIFPKHGIEVENMVGDLSIAERQMVEIAIAFSERDTPPSLVILDEPTSSLDAAIAQQLLSYVRIFCEKGGAVIIISHMMGEIFDVASRIAVMKDGQIIEDNGVETFTRESLVDLMGNVIDESDASVHKSIRQLGKIVLKTVEGLSARQHEIVGLAGLAGHGQAEALAAFYMSRSSLWKSSSKPEVAFVAGDRARDGVIPLWSIMRNLSLSTLVEFGKFGLVNRLKESTLANDWKARIGIRTDNLNNPILSLSGGNQQKVLFAKALASSAPIVVMDDPMRGVDVGTKKEVYEMIKQEASNGRTFLWYSTETEEICECDRVFVYRDGAISAELVGEQITEENLLHASFEMEGNTI